MKPLYPLLAFSLLTALGFLAGGALPYVLMAALGALLLGITLWKQFEPLAAAGFALLITAAALHAWKHDQDLLALSSVCASLVAWDLVHYGLLLRFTAEPLDRRLFRRRLVLLGIVLVCGWGLGVLALLVKLQLSFGLLLLLGLLVILSLSLSMMYLRRRDEITRY